MAAMNQSGTYQRMRKSSAREPSVPQILMVIRADLVTAVLAGFGRTVLTEPTSSSSGAQMLARP